MGDLWTCRQRYGQADVKLGASKYGNGREAGRKYGGPVDRQTEVPDRQMSD